MQRLRHLLAQRPVYLRVLGHLLNVIVTVGLVYILYRQLVVQGDAVTLFDGFRQNFLSRPRWPSLLLIVALMPVNLWLEAYKLRIGMPAAQRAPWPLALRQICAGIAFGLWTPGRVGEFGGRMVGTTTLRDRAYVVASTSIGGLAQWVPLLLGGGVSVLLWQKLFPNLAAPANRATTTLFQHVTASPLTEIVAWSCIGIALLMCVGFWRKPQLLAWARQLWRAEWRYQIPQGLDEIQTGPLLLASLMRYLVYLLQMSLAFSCFGLDLSLALLLTGTAALFLLHGFLPLPPALQALARVELALLIFAFAKPNELVILAASAFIFALNLALPALLGWWFIVRPDAKSN